MFRNSFVGYIRRNSVFRRFTFASAIVLLLLMLDIICPVYYTVDKTEAAVGTATQSSLSFNFIDNKNTASVSLNVSDKTGSFAASSSNELAEFGLTTNNATGYTLKLRTNGVDTSLSNGTNSIDSIDSAQTSSSFAVNTWGLFPSKYNSAVNTINYYPVDETGFIIDETSSSNNENNVYTLGLGIKADYLVVAGVYSSADTRNNNSGISILLEYVANPVNYSITYADNTEDSTVDGIPYFGADITNHTQSGSVSSTSIPLSNGVPTRVGYTFSKWCLGVVSDNGTICTGTEFASGASFGIDQTSANDITIYALWTPNPYTISIKTVTGISSVSLNGVGCASSAGCDVSGLYYGQSYTLTAIASDGYTFNDWDVGDYGSISDLTNSSTIYTVGAGNSIITPSATINNYSLSIAFAGTGVSSVKVCKTSGNCSGTDLMGTVSSSGGSVSSLTYNETYYLYPTFSTNYTVDNWKKTNSYGSLAGVTTVNTTSTVLNPTFTMGAGNGAVTITGKSSLPTITFNAGSNISYIIVADGSNRYKPYYAASGSSTSITAAAGTSFIVTVVPRNNYKLGSWSGSTSGLTSTTLLTTTYTVPAESATLTATGVSGTYTAMSSLTNATCSTDGTNVTDTRNGVSYTVKKIELDGTNTCWMLSNLRLNGGITLTPSNSNVSSNFALSSGSWTSSSQNYYCKQNMKYINGEYYYNWYAAMANPYECNSPTSSTNATETNDAKSLGDICPKGWRVPTAEINPVSDYGWRINSKSDELDNFDWRYSMKFTNGNLASLIPSGSFVSGSQNGSGSTGFLWSSTRYSDSSAFYDSLNAGTGTYLRNNYKYSGYSVRCMIAGSTITFEAGQNIDYVIASKSGSYGTYKPYYASTGNSVSLVAEPGSKLIVTVVPKANFKLDSWSGDIGGLADTSLLTTSLTVPNSNASLTATGISGTYTSISSLTLADCSTSGTNVTDYRNGVSYTVKKMTLNNVPTCWSMINLRLDGGITLTPSDSNVSTDYVLPSQADWVSSSCSPSMATANGEYYYNWAAASARTDSTTSTSACDDANNSVGDICPKGWRMPTASEIGNSAWRNSLLPNATNGAFSAMGYYNGRPTQYWSHGFWWCSSTNTNYRYLTLSSTGLSTNFSSKSMGLSVRCMRTS